MKIGDTVALIDEDLCGVVTSIHGNEVVFKDSHGFTHRCKKNRLVIRNPSLYEGISTEKKAESFKKVSKKHSVHQLKIDLHFEKVVPNPEKYDSFERIMIQKEELLNKIEYCRKNNIKKVQIIHGIGDGTLQRMVYEVLESQTGIEFHNKEILHHQSGTVIVFLQ